MLKYLDKAFWITKVFHERVLQKSVQKWGPASFVPGGHHPASSPYRGEGYPLTGAGGRGAPFPPSHKQDVCV